MTTYIAIKYPGYSNVKFTALAGCDAIAARQGAIRLGLIRSFEEGVTLSHRGQRAYDVAVNGEARGTLVLI